MFYKLIWVNTVGDVTQERYHFDAEAVNAYKDVKAFTYKALWKYPDSSEGILVSSLAKLPGPFKVGGRVENA